MKRICILSAFIFFVSLASAQTDSVKWAKEINERCGNLLSNILFPATRKVLKICTAKMFPGWKLIRIKYSTTIDIFRR